MLRDILSDLVNCQILTLAHRYTWIIILSGDTYSAFLVSLQQKVDMYNPKGSYKEKSVNLVQFTEIDPPDHLRGVVNKYLELKTEMPLAVDYRFHAIPDACTYVVFDQLDTNITAVTRLNSTSLEFNLGKSFHFVNIQLLPGVWQNNDHLCYGKVDQPYTGNLPLINFNENLAKHDLFGKVNLLTRVVEHLMTQKLVVANPATEKIFWNIDEINSVSDMATALRVSPRQIQRMMKKTTGFKPHDFLKILRLQKALIEKDTSSYADQSHFIHSFRKATGYTPARYTRKFDI